MLENMQVGITEVIGNNMESLCTLENMREGSTEEIGNKRESSDTGKDHSKFLLHWKVKNQTRGQNSVS